MLRRQNSPFLSAKTHAQYFLLVLLGRLSHRGRLVLTCSDDADENGSLSANVSTIPLYGFKIWLTYDKLGRPLLKLEDAV